MLIILTRPCGIHPFNSEWVKYYAARISGKRRGPEMVARSLSRGLDELGVPHLLNPLFVPHSISLAASNSNNALPHQTEKDFTVHVVGGAKTLEWALRMKKAGKIKTLIAGPAISVVPDENNSILKNPLIDKIVLPSQWTKDLYVSFDEYYKNTIEVWPAGVQANVAASNRKNGRGVVYCKFVPPEIKDAVTKFLSAQNVSYDIFEYGNFKQADYYAALEKSDWMIYLSPSESQGIALQEAWIRDVPTLVWSPGVWNYKGRSWKDPLISAPYLTAESGSAFAGGADFKTTFEKFMSDVASFTPRAHCMKNLTDVKSAERFAEIMKSIKSK